MRPILSATNDIASMKVVQALDGEQVKQRVIIPNGVLPLAYLIRGKVQISYAGALVLAERFDIKLYEPEAKEFHRSKLVVAVARAYNPRTQITQVGASQWDNHDWFALRIAKELARRNAIRKVIPEYYISLFANQHAVLVKVCPSKDGRNRTTKSLRYKRANRHHGGHFSGVL